MNRTPRRIRMIVLAVLAVMGCAAVVALGALVAGGVWLDPSRIAPTVTSTSTQARSMKGWELYSWQMQGEWHFSLVVGTNRLKTFEEISSPEVSVEGIEALKMELDKLARGEQVFWLVQRVPGAARPPDEMLDAIHAHCAERGLRLETDWE
jgi:hypothetical protein